MYCKFDLWWNFQLEAALRETRYLAYIDIENLPQEAIDLYRKSDELYEWNLILHKSVGW